MWEHKALPGCRMRGLSEALCSRAKWESSCGGEGWDVLAAETRTWLWARELWEEEGSRASKQAVGSPLQRSRMTLWEERLELPWRRVVAVARPPSIPSAAFAMGQCVLHRMLGMAAELARKVEAGRCTAAGGVPQLGQEAVEWAAAGTGFAIPADEVFGGEAELPEEDIAAHMLVAAAELLVVGIVAHTLGAAAELVAVDAAAAEVLDAATEPLAADTAAEIEMLAQAVEQPVLGNDTFPAAVALAAAAAEQDPDMMTPGEAGHRHALAAAAAVAAVLELAAKHNP